MTSKQLTKLAKSLGWVLHRHGGKHQIYRHALALRPVTIPYQTRDHVGKQIKKQLQSVTVV